VVGDKSGERIDDDVLTLGSNPAPGTTYLCVGMSRVAGTSNERRCGSHLSESWFGLTIHSILSCRRHHVDVESLFSSSKQPCGKDLGDILEPSGFLSF
jgi:hypothetical protein